MINNQNYFSTDSSKKFMSCSQFKQFQNCEAMALAEINKEYQRESSTALLVGSYVDAWFEGTLEDFKSSHPEIFLKSGGLKADYIQADEIIKRVQADEVFMKYMGGEKQVIFTGEIAEVPFKAKLDSYHENKCIVDLKCMRDFEPIWKNRRKMSFVEAWGYDIQGAIYQELVYQATGNKLPFYICAVSKEKVPDIAVFEIPQERLDYCLAIVKSNVVHYQQVKNGELEAERCGKCDYCKVTKKASVMDYRELNPELFQEPPQATTEPISVSSIVSLPYLENPQNEPSIKVLEGKKVKKKKKKKKSKTIVIKL